MEKITPIETNYNGRNFRSRTEARWAVFFDSAGIAYEYEKEGYELDCGRYLPDFWLPEWNAFVEIKGDRPTANEIERCLALQKATEKPVYLLCGAPDFNRLEHGCKFDHGFLQCSIYFVNCLNFFEAAMSARFEFESRNNKAEGKKTLVYLAGKIEANCWRHALVPQLSGWRKREKNVLETVAKDVFYTGPQFSCMGHFLNHGPTIHGHIEVADIHRKGHDPYLHGQIVLNRSKDAIKQADIVFAYIDSFDCYGTIAEIGFAHALGKTIFIVYPINFNFEWNEETQRNELWFIEEMADAVGHTDDLKGYFVKLFERKRIFEQKSLILESSEVNQWIA